MVNRKNIKIMKKKLPKIKYNMANISLLFSTTTLYTIICFYSYDDNAYIDNLGYPTYIHTYLKYCVSNWFKYL